MTRATFEFPRLTIVFDVVADFVYMIPDGGCPPHGMTLDKFIGLLEAVKKAKGEASGNNV